MEKKMEDNKESVNLRRTDKLPKDKEKKKNKQ